MRSFVLSFTSLSSLISSHLISFSWESKTITMALLLLSHLSLLPSSSSLSSPSPSPSIPIAAATLSSKAVHRSFGGIRIPGPSYAFVGKRSVIVRASAGIDGKNDDDNKSEALPPSQSSEESAVSVENLPLESKAKERMEQKLRMKLAKKIRLRRKRLLRKRKMRKKGRWPPSKMKKLKNV